MSVRGIDHVGVTVPDVEAATDFLVAAFGAEVLYDTLRADEPPKEGPATTDRLGVPGTAREVRIRMLALPGGPGIELFAFDHVDQDGPAVPSDLGWQHLALYVDDLDATLERVVAAGATALGEPRPLPGPEAGERNRFVYVRTPWGSTVELLTYPDPQPYEEHTSRRRWHP
ncbi:VOC family protein [Curtobacterium pusillum]|uniref:VOC family protein n=1 Tax=Curtobacterium pusillum TaxID=69373 RepID=UPI00380ACB7C